jgi:hypothetical protein
MTFSSAQESRRPPAAFVERELSELNIIFTDVAQSPLAP